MINGKITITNLKGLHLRPATILCQEAMSFKSSIHFQTRNANVNAKSVLSVLGACVKHGEEIEILCEGEDEEVAFARIMKLIQSGLGDDLENIGIDK